MRCHIWLRESYQGGVYGLMKAYYLAVIAVLLVVFGMLLYPNIRELLGFIDTTGWLPLTKAGFTALPYLFLLFILYGIFKQAKE